MEGKKTNPEGKTTGSMKTRAEHRMRQFSDWLQQQSEKLSIKTKKILLVFACFLFASVLLWQAVSGWQVGRLPNNDNLSQPKLPPVPQGFHNDTLKVDSNDT